MTSDDKLIELIPIEQDLFAEQNQSIVGLPVVVNLEKFIEAIWPRPDVQIRIFIKVTTNDPR